MTVLPLDAAVSLQGDIPPESEEESVVLFSSSRYSPQDIRLGMMSL